MEKNILRTRLNQHLMPISLGLALLLAALPSAQAAGWYQFEMILFLNKDGLVQSSDHWLTDPGTPDIAGARLLQGAGGGAHVPLSSAAFKLIKQRRQLDRSGRYETLLHTAWRQPVRKHGQPKKFYFQFPGGGRSPISREETDPFAPKPRLQGTIAISRGRYLHADLDVVYRELRPPRPAGTSLPEGEVMEDPGIHIYRLTEKRRMRRDELHYLDHPALGALIIAERYAMAEPTPEEPEETDTAEPAPAADETATKPAAKALEPN